MLEALKIILDIQELDMKMIRLMRLKRDRTKELDQIESLKKEIRQQLELRKGQVLETKKDIKLKEVEAKEVNERIKSCENKQSAVKKVEEFNALSQEIAQSERARTNVEQRLSDLTDSLDEQEEVVAKLVDSLDSTKESSQALEKEIKESIDLINSEGAVLLVERKKMSKGADPEVLSVYDRLLGNKRDRVVVPIESRTCSGCHIVLTAQHENLVRKGERLVFCEHCSRIHFWQDSEAIEGTAVETKRRRRRKITAGT